MSKEQVVEDTQISLPRMKRVEISDFSKEVLHSDVPFVVVDVCGDDPVYGGTSFHQGLDELAGDYDSKQVKFVFVDQTRIRRGFDTYAVVSLPGEAALELPSDSIYLFKNGRLEDAQAKKGGIGSFYGPVHRPEVKEWLSKNGVQPILKATQRPGSN